MQIQISSKDLLRGINAVARVILNKNSLPVLANVFFSQNGQRFTLTASDGDNELTTDISLVVLEGSFMPFCIDPELLQGTLATLGDQPLTLTVTDTGNGLVNVNVRYLNGQFNVTGFTGTEYPRINVSGIEIAHFTASAPRLLTMMAAAAQCTANDELRPVMASVLLDVCASDPASPMPEEVVVVGSDGHVLYKNVLSRGEELVFNKTDGQARLLVNRNLVSKFANAFKGAGQIEVIALGREQEKEVVIHNIRFLAPGVDFITRAVEGRYPNYNSVIPQQHKYDALFNVKTLMQSMHRVSQFASVSNQMLALKREGFETLLYAEDIDFSRSSKESIDCVDCNLPDKYAVGMKSSTILQHLGNISTENVRMLFSEPARAIVLKDDDVASPLTLLLMPMSLNP